jgi:hypothetical protein
MQTREDGLGGDGEQFYFSPQRRQDAKDSLWVSSMFSVVKSKDEDTERKIITWCTLVMYLVFFVV